MPPAGESGGKVRSAEGITSPPVIAILVGAVLLLVSFFLPFASASAEYRQVLDSSGQSGYEEFGMTPGDTKDISLFEFARMYLTASSSDQSALQVMRAELIICLVIMLLIAVFSLLVLLFAILRHPIPVIVFALLAIAMFMALRWDFKDRGILPDDNYSYGVANYMYFVSVIVLLAGSIWLIVSRRKAKRHTA